MKRLSKYTIEGEHDGSFLGDILVKDVDLGNSIPVLTNPKLVNVAPDGDMDIEVDISYTGGIRIEVGTNAMISVPAWVFLM
jgi:hypothetical protein